MPLEIPGRAGKLECLLNEPPAMRGVDGDGRVQPGAATGVRAAVVFAHPHPQYGGTMHTKVVYQSAKALARIGCAVLRFNFRGVGLSAGEFDAGIGEKADFLAAVAFMHERYPTAPLWAAGMSFGSWIALTAGAEDPDVSLLLGVAIPSDRYNFEAMQTSPKPKFLIHGERDEITPLKQIRAFYAQCADPKELTIIDGADHLFDGKVGEVADALEDLLEDWPGR